MSVLADIVGIFYKECCFEQLIKKILLTSPLYSEIYEKVWTWNEFPYNENKHDYGIDLVAKVHGTDEYHAIQCKFYKEVLLRLEKKYRKILLSIMSTLQ